MERGTSRVKIFDSVGLGMGFAAMLIAAGAVFGDRPATGENIVTETRGKIHKCTFPVIDANSPPGCEAEAAGYAAALITLQAAQDNADDAYAAWASCLNGTPGDPDPLPLPLPIDHHPLATEATEPQSIAANDETVSILSR